MKQKELRHDITVDVTAPLLEVLTALDDNKSIGTLIVTDAGRVVSTINDGDVRGALLNSRRADISKIRASEIMATNPLILRKGRPRLPAILKGHKRGWGVRLVPVVDARDQLIDILDLRTERERHPLEVLTLTIRQPATDANSLQTRRTAHDHVNFRNHEQRIGLLASIPQNEHEALRQTGLLDEFLVACDRAKDWLGHQMKILGDPIFELREQQVKTRIGKLLSFAEVKMTANRPIGASKTIDSPSIISVLGCKGPHERNMRVGRAAKLITELWSKKSNNPIRCIVLTGGGTSGKQSEAAAMKADLYAALPPNIRDSVMKLVILEEDSLDTVGNAVFSYFAIKMNGIENPCKQSMVVVTSAYHATRAFNIYSHIFGKGKVAVVPVAVEGPEGFGHRQLRSEHRANRESFALENYVTGLSERLRESDVEGVLRQIIRLHDQYRNRSDLMRKYSPLIG